MKELLDGENLDFWENGGASKVEFVAKTRPPLECVRRAEQIAGIVEAKFQISVLAALDLSREDANGRKLVDEWRRDLMKKIRAGVMGLGTNPGTKDL